MNYSLKVERAKMNFIQQDVADRVGVSRQRINSIESERYVPSSALALKISELFNTTVNEIIKLEKDD